MPSVLQYKLSSPHLDLPLSHRGRSYSLLEFPSGLRCLLISDPSSPIFAAAMAVGGGSFDEPDELPGLAHLCEHMLVLGTKEDPYGLHRAVTRSGGSVNASTSGEQTCFGFEISTFAHEETTAQPFFIDSLLPKFASYFKDPQFLAAHIKAEINAVNEEHSANTANDQKMLLHGLRLLASTSHPFSRFATGDSNTLTKVNAKKLRSYLKTYYSRVYLPQNMALVIKGPHTINHLRKLAAANFGEVAALPSSPRLTQNRDSKLSEFSLPSYTNAFLGSTMHPFENAEYNSIFIKAAGPATVRLCFPTSSSCLSEPAQRTLCNLIGDESEGTLCELLKNKYQLAKSVFVFTEQLCAGHSLFIVSIELTGLGMKCIVKVINTVLWHLENRIPNLKSREAQRMADEYAKIEEFTFLGLRPPAPLNEVTNYAEKLQGYGNCLTNSLIRGYQKWEDISYMFHDPQWWKTNGLTGENAFLQILADDFKLFSSIKDCKSEIDPHFGFEYVRFNYQLGSDNRTDFKSESKAPQPIGELVDSIVTTDHKVQPKPLKIRDMAIGRRLPELIRHSENCEFWYQELEQTVVDNSTISIHMHLSHLPCDAEHLVGLELLVAIVGNKLKYKLYHSELIGSTWSMYANVNGDPSILISISSPQCAMAYLIRTIFKELLEQINGLSDLPYSELKKARNTLRTKYEEYSDAKGIKKVSTYAYAILEEDIIAPEERIDALEMHANDSLHQLGLRMKKLAPFISILFSGDTITEDQMRDFTTNLCTWQPESQHLSVELALKSSHWLQEGAKYLYNMEGTTDDNTSVVLYYLQTGKREDAELFAMTKLCQHILESTALEALRTRRHLAYCVLAGLKVNRQTCGLHITVPSGKHDTSYLIEQIEEYLMELEFELSNLSERDFKTKYLNTFAESIDEDSEHEGFPSNLFANVNPVCSSDRKADGIQFSEHWNNLDQILSSSYRFGGRRCEEHLDRSFAQTITLKQFLEFFKHKITSKDASVLIVANKACTKLSEKKLNSLCNRFGLVIREAGLPIQDEEIKVLLQQCEDKESFSDLNKVLLKHFQGSKHYLKFKAFELKSRAGALMQKLTAKTNYSKPKNSIGKRPKEIMDYTQIQRESSLAESPTLLDKLNLLASFNSDYDIGRT